MSLIQEALSKTSTAPGGPQAQRVVEPKAKPIPKNDQVEKLKELDARLEKDLQGTKGKQSFPLWFYLFALLSVSVVAYFFLSSQPSEMNVPATVSPSTQAPVSSSQGAEELTIGFTPAGNLSEVKAEVPVKSVPAQPAPQKVSQAQVEANEAFIEGLILSGLMYSGDESSIAVINGEIVTIGDMVGKRALVKDIQADYVVLEAGGETSILVME